MCYSRATLFRDGSADLTSKVNQHLLKGPPPRSFHDFHKSSKKNPGRYVIPPFSAIESQLVDFWERYGERTKAYRDCFIHFATLAGATWQHHVNMKWENGRWHVDFELPNNPETKSYDSFTYDGKCDALHICLEISQGTTATLEALMRVCLDKWNAQLDKAVAKFEVRNVRIGEAL